MTDKSLFVFDTNTLVSALLFTNSKPAYALQKALSSGFLVGSQATYAELNDVLMRAKFDKYVSRESRQQFLSTYRNAVLWIDVVRTITVCRDPKDDKFLEAASNANAAYLITGDDDLLVLHPFEGVQIVTPADFLLGQLI
jgi:uncharacterized protein